MTDRQAKVLDALKTKLLYRESESLELREFKEFRVTDTDFGIVYLYAEVWDPGWKGTLAEAICTKRYHVAISRGGGMELLNGRSKSGKARKAHHVKLNELEWQVTM